MGLDVVLWRGLLAGDRFDGVSGRCPAREAYGSAVAGRGISLLLMGLLAIPDMSELGRILAADEDEGVDSTDCAVPVEVVDVVETTLEGTGGASVFARLPRCGLDCAGEAVGAAMAVFGLGGWLRAALAALSAAMRSLNADLAPLALAVVAVPPVGLAADEAEFGLCESFSKAVFAFASNVFIILITVSMRTHDLFTWAYPIAWSGQFLANVQYVARMLSLTFGSASSRHLLMVFSARSRPPELSK